ncbi:thiol:disulfide interchange protein DsbA/DsbL [Salinispira pacifica]
MKDNRTFVAVTLAAAILALSAAAVSAEPVATSATPAAGVDYSILSHPAPVKAPDGKIHVTEVFWYGCPYCQDFEPLFGGWVAAHSDQITLERLPAPLGDNLIVGAKVFFALEKMGVEERFHDQLLAAAKAEQIDVSEESSFADWLAARGVSRSRFEQEYNSNWVSEQVAQARKRVLADEILTIPSLVVDGTYVTSSQMAKGYQQVLSVANYLVAKAQQQ